MNKDDSFCILPFIGTCIEAGGRHKPCCRYTQWSEESDARKQSLKELINEKFYKDIQSQFLKGEKPEGCKRCWTDEAKGIQSMRQTYSNDYRNLLTPENLTHPEVKIIDYGFGNVCNAACITCQGRASSLWKNDETFLQSIEGNPFNRHQFPILKDTYPHWTDQDYKRLHFISHGQNESLLSPEFEKSIDRLIKMERTNDVILDLSTNGSYFLSDSVIEKLPKFKRINVHLSVDGVGEKNEYLRYPLKWQKVEENISKWLETAQMHSNFYLRLHCTVSALNVLDLKEISDWWDQISDHHNSKQINPIHFGYCWDPIYLNPTILPINIKRAAVEKFAHPFLKKLLDADDNNEESKNLDLFLNFVRTMDKRRSLHYSGTFPELFNALNS